MNKTILLIDDDSDFTLLVRTLLGNQGYDFVVAHSLADVAPILKKIPVHGILLDLMLSKESGFSLLIMRKQDREFQEIPVIMLSGSQQLDHINRAISLGATDYATKPIQTQALLETLNKHIKNKPFHKKTFLPDDPSADGTCLIHGTVTKVSESKIIFDTPVRLGLDKPIEFHCKFFEPYLKPMINFKNSMNTPFFWSHNRYSNELSLYGLTPEQSKQVRINIQKRVKEQ